MQISPEVMHKQVGAIYVQQKAFDPFRGADLSPGPAVTTDGDIDAHVPRKAETTIMTGEKAADLIRVGAPNPPIDVPVFVHPEWRTQQRWHALAEDDRRLRCRSRAGKEERCALRC